MRFCARRSRRSAASLYRACGLRALSISCPPRCARRVTPQPPSSTRHARSRGRPSIPSCRFHGGWRCSARVPWITVSRSRFIISSSTESRFRCCPRPSPPATRERRRTAGQPTAARSRTATTAPGSTPSTWQVASTSMWTIGCASWPICRRWCRWAATAEATPDAVWTEARFACRSTAKSWVCCRRPHAPMTRPSLRPGSRRGAGGLPSDPGSTGCSSRLL